MYFQCHDICSENNTAISEDKKFQHKWIFDENLVYCKETGIWCLTYIDGKGMFCSLYRLTNALLNDLCIQNLEL